MKKSLFSLPLVLAVSVTPVHAVLEFEEGEGEGSLGYVDANLSFVTPHAVVDPDDTIEIWARLSLSDYSEPLYYDPTDAAPYGLHESIFPEFGYNYSLSLYDVPFAEITGSYLSSGRNCSGNFTEGCSAGEYTYSYDAVPGSTWFDIEQPFLLEGGESRDFYMGSFIPTDGSAEPGDYVFYNASLSINIEGLDAEGNPLQAEVYLPGTCSSQSESCAFTRTVVAPVPLPAAVWLMLTAVAGLPLLRRRA